MQIVKVQELKIKYFKLFRNMEITNYLFYILPRYDISVLILKIHNFTNDEKVLFKRKGVFVSKIIIA